MIPANLLFLGHTFPLARAGVPMTVAQYLHGRPVHLSNLVTSARITTKMWILVSLVGHHLTTILQSPHL